MKVLIAQPIRPEGIRIIEQVAEVKPVPSRRPLCRREFLSAITDCDGVVLPWHTDVMDREAIELCPNLKVIGRQGVGYENIDLDVATSRGIYCTYTPVHIETVADMAFCLLMTAARRLIQADRFVKQGMWEIGGDPVYWGFLGLDIHHKTLGVIGAGRIGACVGRRAKGFDMHIIYHDVLSKPDFERELAAEQVDLETLLRESDFVVISCPLTPSTRGLIGSKQFEIMRRTCIVVNCARGPVIDHAAMVEALRDGIIAGAGLDVYGDEPLPRNDPIMSLDNAVLAPHVGSATMEARDLMATTVAEDVVAVLTGKAPRFLLNAAVKNVRPLAGRRGS